MIYNPATDDMYLAERGQGAYHNNRRMRVSSRRQLADTMIACGIPPSPRRPGTTASGWSWRR